VNQADVQACLALNNWRLRGSRDEVNIEKVEVE
jgi:hypothetical protein